MNASHWNLSWHNVLCAAALMGAVLVSHVRADTNFWQPLAPLEGGWIASLYYDSPTDVVYAGTTIQSAYGLTGIEGTLLRSSDHGATWVDIGTGLAKLTSWHRVQSVTRTPAGVIFVALHTGGVARSSDEGANWSLVNSGLTSSVKPLQVQFAPDGTGYVVSESAGTYVSTNGGSSWSASTAGLTNLNTRGIAFMGADVFVGTRGAGVFKRTGFGTWVPVNTGLGGMIINSIRMLPDGRLSAATDAGAWVMNVNTNTWTELLGPFSGTVCSATFGTGTTLFVGGINGLDSSSDGGQTWQAADAGIPPTLGVPLIAADNGGRLFAGTTRSGIFRSLDNATSWQSANTGIHAHSVHRIAVGANGTIHVGCRVSSAFRSVDGGASWEGPTLFGWSIFAISVSPWGDVFAGNYNITAGVSDGHVWRSQDDGQTWSMVGGNLGAAMISGFDFPAPNQVSCTAAWAPGGIWKSSNNGDVFAHVAPPQSIPAYCLTRTPNGDMYFGTEGQGVWRVPGDGRAAVNMGMSTSQQLAIAADAQGRVYVGSDRNLSALWRSEGAGQPFQATALPGLECFAVLALPDGTLFAGTRAYGIHRSFDQGNTWEQVNSGINTTSCFSLALGSDGHLFAGVPGGVFRSTAPVVCVADLNGDHIVDGADLGVLLGQWNGSGSADLDHDGVVTGADLGQLLGAWGACPN
jgi:photosystem II stability/assembly factor-like uncharacterized protein